jgi:peptidoglycan/xylan/chitin deacetylase (PgdA/CDA1 family)
MSLLYFVKTPFWLKMLYPKAIWDIPSPIEKVLYLTFDDGPHSECTTFVLDQLKKYNAEATFFCIGKNVDAHFDVYKRIIEEGHAVANHTNNHLNGWKAKDEDYLLDIRKAMNIIDSKLYRPPYGRITRFQLSQLLKPAYKLYPIMWSVLSGDFDKDITPEKCASNVILKAHSGDIVVFHDSEKASERLKYALPKVLSYFSQKGFVFKKITPELLKGYPYFSK